jgi:large subunit ribosomal protein LP0
MPRGETKLQKKANYFRKLINLMDSHNRMLLVSVDNVGSFHMQTIRRALRGKATLLMGKNTLIRKAIRQHVDKRPELGELERFIKGNIGFVFTNEEVRDIKDLLDENTVAAAAKIGAISPGEIVVPKGPTGMEPTKTSFFQAVGIPSTIMKGQISIANDVILVKAGERVNPSQAMLLQQLNIKPFKYGLKIATVFDNGSIYDPKILEWTSADVLNKFRANITDIASLSLEIGYPTLASTPHSLLNGYRNLLAVAVATPYTFPQVEELKDRIENPDKYASAEPEKVEEEAPEEEAQEEEEEESDSDIGMGGLF